MKDTLTAILATGSIPADLAIIYDDMHGLWGGATLSVRGDGSLERHTKAPGAPAAQVSRTTVERQALLGLVGLLVHLDAWDQRTPERPPVPDESRASLTISVGGCASRTWERFNDLAANNRLVQIKAWLERA